MPIRDSRIIVPGVNVADEVEGMVQECVLDWKLRFGTMPKDRLIEQWRREFRQMAERTDNERKAFTPLEVCPRHKGER